MQGAVQDPVLHPRVGSRPPRHVVGGIVAQCLRVSQGDACGVVSEDLLQQRWGLTLTGQEDDLADQNTICTEENSGCGELTPAM